MVQRRVTPGTQNQAQRTQSVSPIGLVVNGLHCAASHTHTTSLRCHPHVPTFEPCPTWGMVQMRVTPGPQNQAQRTQSVSPIGLVVNGLHCAASHTHTTSLRCHPHVPTFEPCRFFVTSATTIMLTVLA